MINVIVEGKEIKAKSIKVTDDAVEISVKQDFKKATFLLEASLHKQLKKQAAIEGRNMADIVTEALTEYLRLY